MLFIKPIIYQLNESISVSSGSKWRQCYSHSSVTPFQWPYEGDHAINSRFNKWSKSNRIRNSRSLWIRPY
jgi:hypothetical protein